jgi:spore germination cell wall hydrolase CwlJ-like protein
MNPNFFAVMLTLAGAAAQGCSADAPPPEAATKSAELKASVLEKKAAEPAGEAKRSSATAAELITPTEVQTVDPGGTGPLNDAITCLARTIYWEARGEGTAGMEAVTSVVMNRLSHEGFPKTVCEVVRQGQQQNACQFSWWCDGRSDDAKEDKSYAVAKEIARTALNRQLTDRTAGALYFHQRTVAPSWSNQYIKTLEAGEFIFYKPPNGAAR